MPKIFVFGLDNAGKSSIIYYLLNQKISTNLHPTLGIQINKLNLKSLDFSIWDSPGQKQLRHTWKDGFEGADLLIFVVDLSVPKRFYEAKEVFNKFLGDIHTVNIPLIICLHKIDVPKSLENVKEAKSVLDLDTKSQREMFYLQTTVNSPETIDLIRYLMQLMLSKEFKQGCTDGILDFNQS
jgi:small GTP-binding protein